MIKNRSLSVDQKEALKDFSFWLDEKNIDKPFLLSGYAGSGKTYLGTKFLQLVEDRNICWTVAAPTHKAVGVLRNAIEKEGLRPTWYPSTIHRLLRLKLKRRGNLEVCEQTSQTAKSLDQLGLVLVDEASMVDSNLLEIVITCAHSHETRLVFVGDPAQLPPVGEEASPVFSLQRVKRAHLTEVIRHQGPVLKLASLIREEGFTCSMPPCFPIVRTKTGLIGSLDQKSWLEKAKSSLREAAEKNDPDSIRILCYTNRYLERLVPHARRAVHGQLADEMSVLPGEVLISRRAVMTTASLESDNAEEEPGILLGSNAEIVVEDVKNQVFDLFDLDLEFEEKYDLDLPQINTLVAKVSAGNNKYLIRLMPELGTNSRLILEELMQDLCNLAKKLPKREARAFWKKFFYVRDSFASVGPASVLTVHRSQGSTFQEVFIAADVFFASDLSLRKQLVYVAVSRASEKVWLAGDNSINSLNSPWCID
ncbi:MULTISPECIES: AAA family ATPase [Prochlorococcus]|uniref:DNA helicase related to phage enzyme n=1 Tax=Prochlorococcus marinus (strain SARG / CCMP1375 / SS120) TaxID=167539 RepID=Q7VBG7_PROMA|nr:MULTISPECIES: AAA family ATPase [Prochlorococcus]AAQ00172.1 DNA helicase related to phage enzyme [Prochlorococcus marinus subsp. marinus str. CCMP1375]KGG13970.1 DNA helicase related to phage enzyme [Prochlorococcus marinus str. LG]KGG19103.1 DNA helicase related to phage enzyme [Prochlorococcus marinus str. SS2]KGG23357.1 DNA helicase related to phage enzyme [Prochlorococcus marinus str. SS35]KGG32407.1 DNA helicase related to phage enzyme [Prochlorococcus marinus str. SS51]